MPTTRSRPGPHRLVRLRRVLVCGLMVACESRRLTAPQDSGRQEGGSGMPDVALFGHDVGGHADASDPGQGGMDGRNSEDLRPCRENADCQEPGIILCVPPGGSAGCGVCFGDRFDRCTSDDECQAGGKDMICDVVDPCCDRNAKGCVPGCVDATGCSEGEACTAHRCVPLSCQTDANCPTNFECSQGRCRRKSCTTDASCIGYCVEGSCYSTLGTCRMPNL